MMIHSLVKSTFIRHFICQRRMYNYEVRAMAQTLEILQGKSTAQGGLCHIYLLGVTHDTEESKREAHALVNHLKPEVLFLELDEKRAKDMVKSKWYESEFYVAYMEGLRCGSRIIFGDRDATYSWSRVYKRFHELLPSCKPQNVVELYQEIIGQVLRDERNVYMINGLLSISKHSSSVLAIVGEAHVPGMKFLWDKRGPGMAPPSMGQQPPQQYQQPPQQPPYVLMPPQPQAPPPMWAPSAQPPSQQPASADEVRTLWIGDLQYWMDENYLYTSFAHTGEVTSVKVIRNKQTSQSEGYGFIEFNSRAAAERVLQTYNGAIMPNGGQSFRLNWATFSAGERCRHDDGPDYTIFVGDLAADDTDYLLQETFRTRYNSVKGAKVVIDRLTGRSKGYGFVRFADESEQMRAMTEMQGVVCSTRPMRIGPASNKNPATTQSQPKASYQNPQGAQNKNDPNNTTIFVGNLDPNVTDVHLRQVFSQYGELVHVKIPAGKRCGFVQFADRSCAEEALRILNGTLLGGQNVRLSWGRSPSNKQGQQDPNPWGAGAGGYYGYGRGYENYGYVPPAGQDPNMYGSYPGHASYLPPQQ